MADFARIAGRLIAAQDNASSLPPITAGMSDFTAADGYAVIVHAHRHRESAEHVAEKIAANGGTATVATFDVVDGHATAQALQQLLKEGPIQVLVNNAGLHEDAPMAGMTEHQWKHVIDVSLNGFFHVTQPLLLPMIGTLFGNYKITHKLGAGGQGTVYKAIDQKLGRTVVIKVLTAELTVKETNLKRAALAGMTEGKCNS